MHSDRLLDSLNNAQRAAVSAPPGPILVLAGAGSGKTRVLAHRIAWLLETKAASPSSILAVTFTNKAAREVRGRIETLCDLPLGGMSWIGTFHGLCHRLLRLHWHAANLPQAFQVLDSDDQLRQIRRILRDLALDETKFPPRQVTALINHHKDEGRRANHVQPADNNPYEQGVVCAYTLYEKACARGGLVDFAELLLRTHELLRDNPFLLTHYQERFRHLLVDEFQDTNNLQYSWLRLLAGNTGALFVVGDDDQSIYGWRGARIENIHQFSRDFPGTRIFRLEQNYRSTSTILDAANHLISHNQGRLGKELWTAGQVGEPLLLYAAMSDMEEARFVVERIQMWISQEGGLGDCAILYRSNAQSRLFEQELSRAALPFQVYGGLRFYERAEVKDAIAYLRLMINRNDDAAFERVVNTPTRAIGDRTVESLRELARANEISLWQAAIHALTQQHLAPRAANAVIGFLRFIDELAQITAALEIHEVVDQVVTRAGLVEYYKKEDRLKAEAREENLAELVNAAREYAQQDLESDQRLVRFLSEAALGIEDAALGGDVGAVQLMTLHSAKGLEFPMVFMVGMEEDLFPSARSTDNEMKLEEERRLCYVGMTRAERRLTLVHAEQRRIHGHYQSCFPSRFIKEIPKHLIQDVRLGGSVTRVVSPYQPPRSVVSVPFSTSTPSASQIFVPKPAPSVAPVLAQVPLPLAALAQAPLPLDSPKIPTSVPFQVLVDSLRVGQRVRHPRFGEGVVVQMEGSGPKGRAQIRFVSHGNKWLVLGQAPLAEI